MPLYISRAVKLGFFSAAEWAASISVKKFFSCSLRDLKVRILRLPVAVGKGICLINKKLTESLINPSFRTDQPRLISFQFIFDI